MALEFGRRVRLLPRCKVDQPVFTFTSSKGIQSMFFRNESHRNTDRSALLLSLCTIILPNNKQCLFFLSILNRNIFRSLLSAGIEDTDGTCLSQHTEKDCSLNYSENGYYRSQGDLEILLHGEHIKCICLLDFEIISTVFNEIGPLEALSDPGSDVVTF